MTHPRLNTDEPIERVTIPYTPRREQRVYHADPARFKVLVAHRRLGKTVAAVNEGVKQTIRCALPAAQGAYIAPFRNQAKRVAWSYVKQYAGAIPGVTFEEQELTARLPNGAKFTLYGGDNAHALRGLYLDHAVIDEPAQMHPDLWGQVIRPALSDRRGGATFIGTPCGKNRFFTLYRDAAKLPAWSRLLYTVDDTQIIHPDELTALRAELTEDEYRQEYLCDFEAAIRGAYWGREMRTAEEEGRVTEVPYTPELDVTVAWDLGMADQTVLTYWQVSPAGQVRAIDCDAYTGTGLAQVVKAMREKPYLITENWLPHDIKVRELGTGTSRYEVLWDLGVRGTIVPKLSIHDGIAAVRAMLGRTWFDRSRCATLVEALKTYRTDWDAQRQVLKTTPLHSWESDYADSVRYFAISTAPAGRTFGHQSDLVAELNRQLDREAV